MNHISHRDYYDCHTRPRKTKTTSQKIFNIHVYTHECWAPLFHACACVGLSDKDKNAPALKNVEVVCTVPCRSLLTPSYYHSFGMTENYFIFIEQPLKLDILRMATAYMRGVSWASCLKFCPEENVRGLCFLRFVPFLLPKLCAKTLGKESTGVVSRV